MSNRTFIPVSNSGLVAEFDYRAGPLRRSPIVGYVDDGNTIEPAINWRGEVLSVGDAVRSLGRGALNGAEILTDGSTVRTVDTLAVL